MARHQLLHWLQNDTQLQKRHRGALAASVYCTNVCKDFSVLPLMEEEEKGGGWRANGGGWRVNGGGWRANGGGWRVIGGGWRANGGGWRVNGGGWRANRAG